MAETLARLSVARMRTFRALERRFSVPSTTLRRAKARNAPSEIAGAAPTVTTMEPR
jgi:hypothetical protein